ncbi:hypothetical protein L6R50_00385 [Myxococcota bacterium]|nr:hypothetical protein [Myxococcota bacterium]
MSEDRSAPDDVAREVARLRLDLAVQPDRWIRQHVVAERIRELPPPLAVEVMHALWDGAGAGEPVSQEILLDLATTRPLEESLGYDKVRALYEAAVLGGRPDVARLFVARGAAAAMVSDPDRENEKLASEPLGRRRAIARGRDRFQLDRLLFDRNPAVVRNLLENPRVTERDVVRIAAMRPTTSAVLNEVHRHPRWIGAYRVKKALVFNPYSPADIALSLLVHLLRQDLYQAARAETLHASVRDAARDLLARRALGRVPRPLDPPAAPPPERPSRQDVMLALSRSRRRTHAPGEDARARLDPEELSRVLEGARRKGGVPGGGTGSEPPMSGGAGGDGRGSED